MKLFPCLHKTIQSPLSPEEVRHRLSSHILPAAHSALLDSGTVYWVGRVTSEKFGLRRQHRHTGIAGNSPDIDGRIILTNSGSEIRVTVSPHPSLNLIYLFGMIGLSIYILVCLFGTKAYDAAIGPGLVLLFLIITLPFFRRAARRDNEKAFRYFTELLK